MTNIIYVYNHAGRVFRLTQTCISDDGCVDKSDSTPPIASYDHLSLDVWSACHQEISGEAGDFDPVAVGSHYVHVYCLC